MHYYHLILARKEDLVGRDPNGFVNDLMEPFNESLSVAPHKVTCHCVGDVARAKAEAHGVKEYGTYPEAREDHGKFCEAIDEQRKTENLPPMDENARQETWMKVYITPRERTVRDFFLRHKLRNKPDRTCGFYIGKHWEEEVAKGKLAKELLGKRYTDNSGCGGTGKATVTSNPQGHWDYWQIGGRWTGQLDGYKPEEDKDNIETCTLCGGTGKRDDALGKQERILNPKYTCNGCDGKGKHPKWPTNWKGHEGDIQPVAMLVGKREHVPHSLILPDGTWIEKPKTYLDLSVHADVDRAWERKVLGIFKKYAKGHVAIVMDYHR